MTDNSPSGDERAALANRIDPRLRLYPDGVRDDVVLYVCKPADLIAASDALRAKHTSGPHSPAPGLSEDERDWLLTALRDANWAPEPTACVRAIIDRLTAAEPKAREGKE